MLRHIMLALIGVVILGCGGDQVKSESAAESGVLGDESGLLKDYDVTSRERLIIEAWFKAQNCVGNISYVGPPNSGDGPRVATQSGRKGVGDSMKQIFDSQKSKLEAAGWRKESAIDTPSSIYSNFKKGYGQDTRSFTFILYTLKGGETLDAGIKRIREIGRTKDVVAADGLSNTWPKDVFLHDSIAVVAVKEQTVTEPVYTKK